MKETTYMNRFTRTVPIAALSLAALSGCSDFLTCGECVNDPNRPSLATNTQLFVGVQSNIMATLGSDPARLTGIFARQFSGGLSQYLTLEQTYSINEATTNGFHSALYASGGLVDVRKLQAGALALDDSLFLGIAKVQEAILIGTGADLFGDIVYSQALMGTANPPLDEQMAVYDALQVLLNDAITCLSSSSAGNAGPDVADLAYGGDATKWIRLAHTLKARYFLHTAEVRGAPAYSAAAAQAAQGILDPADDFVGVFSGAAGERNFYYEFDLGAAGRTGYLIPNADFVALLQSRADPRLNDYFNGARDDLSDARLEPDFTQPFITSTQNRLQWAEAAYQSSDLVTAQTQLNAARAEAGLGPDVAVGVTLLTEILTEKYIAEFQTLEAWETYKRNCWPNLTPTVSNRKIPARLPYDANERQTNTSIPSLIDQPSRNDNDPANATDPTGAVCRGQ
jgi:starch-binding outer membrane protein, SusD/RagB family